MPGDIKMKIKTIIKKNGIKYSVRENRDRIFTPNEWIKFYNSLKESQKPLFSSFINTGARINELINIEKRDFDFNKRTLLLRVVKKRNPYSTGKQRLLPLSTEYSNYMKKITKDMKDNQRIFKISKTSISQLFKRRLKKAGIKNYNDFSPHNIRKTLETWLTSLSIGTPVILKHFGHNFSTALEHYIQIDNLSIEDKFKIRKKIIGDLYYSNQNGEFIERRLLEIESILNSLNRI